MKILQPSQRRVLLEKVTEPETTESGLVTSTWTNGIFQGKVIAYGPGEWLEGKFVETSVEYGDIVLFRDQYAQRIHLNGVNYLLVDEDDLLGTLQDDES